MISYVEFEKAELVEIDKNDIYDEQRGGGNEEILTKGYKLLVIRWINSENQIYSLGTIVNNTVLYSWKCLRRVDLKSTWYRFKWLSGE